MVLVSDVSNKSDSQQDVSSIDEEDVTSLQTSESSGTINGQDMDNAANTAHTRFCRQAMYLEEKIAEAEAAMKGECKSVLELMKNILKEEFDELSANYKELTNECDANAIYQRYTELKIRYHNSITEIARKLDSLSNLEPIAIPEFDGTPTAWRSFHYLFKTFVHDRKDLSDREKYIRLKTKVSGAAAGLIKHLPLTDENYAAAWDILKEKFDDKEFQFSAYFDWLLNIPSLNSFNGATARKLANEATECLDALKLLGIEQKRSDPLNAHILLSKLDYKSRALYDEEVKKCGKLPCCADVLLFLSSNYESLDQERCQAPRAFQMELIEGRYLKFNISGVSYTKTIKESIKKFFDKGQLHSETECTLILRSLYYWQEATKNLSFGNFV